MRRFTGHIAMIKIWLLLVINQKITGPNAELEHQLLKIKENIVKDKKLTFNFKRYQKNFEQEFFQETKTADNSVFGGNHNY